MPEIDPPSYAKEAQPADFNLKNLLRLPCSSAAKLMLIEMVRVGERGTGPGGAFFLFELAEQLDIRRPDAEVAKRELERLDVCFRDVPGDQVKLIGGTLWARVLAQSDPDVRAALKLRDEEIVKLNDKIVGLIDKKGKAEQAKAIRDLKDKVDALEVARSTAEAENAALKQLVAEANASLPAGKRVKLPEAEAKPEPPPPAPSEPAPGTEGDEPPPSA